MDRQENEIRVLVSPLDWGLGHASRCIPLIMALQRKGFTVLTAGYGDSHILLQKTFPELKHIPLPGFRVKYSTGGSLVLAALYQLPGFLFHIRKEHRLTGKIVREQNIQIILSDNRYGVRHFSTFNIFVTHQLNPVPPFAAKVLQKLSTSITAWLCKRFDAVWIPDIQGMGNISGQLSDLPAKLHPPVRYLGILSRFRGTLLPVPNPLPDILVLLSGPEPQRSILEDLISINFSNINSSVLIVQGKPGNESSKELVRGNMSYRSHLSSEELEAYLQHVPLIIARAGYSTIMDLLRLGRKAILIPTPGQTEQEYLAKRMKRMGYFFCVSQDEINRLDVAKTGTDGIQKEPGISLQDEEIRNFLKETGRKPDFEYDTMLDEVVTELWEQHHHHKIYQESGKISQVDL